MLRLLLLFLILNFNSFARIETLINEVTQLRFANRYQEALEVLMANKKNNYSDLWLFEFGKTLEMMQNEAMAVFYYQELLDSFPNSPYLAEVKNKLMGLLNFYAEADLLNINLGSIDYLTKAEEFLAKGQHNLAIFYALKCLAYNKDSFRGLFILGLAYNEAYLASKKLIYQEKAIVYFRRAANNIPSARAYNNLACLLFEQKDYIMADYYFNRALELAKVPGLIKVIKNNLSLAQEKNKSNLELFVLNP